jgi:hypothetical protein
MSCPPPTKKTNSQVIVFETIIQVTKEFYLKVNERDFVNYKLTGNPEYRRFAAKAKQVKVKVELVLSFATSLCDFLCYYWGILCVYWLTFFGLISNRLDRALVL